MSDNEMDYGEKQYAARDVRGLCGYYTRHVSAMTAESLHEKSDIAAELAHRDFVADQLRARVAELEHDISRHLAVISEIESERGDLRQARDAAWDRIERLEVEKNRYKHLATRLCVDHQDYGAGEYMAQIQADAQRMGLYGRDGDE